MHKLVNCLIFGTACLAAFLAEGFTQTALADVGVLVPSQQVTQLPPPSLPKVRAPASGRVNRSESERTLLDFDTTISINPFGMICEVTLTGTPAPAAMVLLVLTAPCHQNKTVVIHQGPLVFSATTSALGTLSLSIPAFQSTAAFKAEFSDGEKISVTVAVPDSDKYGRVAIQWAGENKLNIHALEVGAGYSRDKHVWANNPQSPIYAQNLRGGYLTELGGNIMRAEVYSYPLNQAGPRAVVRLSIAATVTEYNCGNHIIAKTLQPGMDGNLAAVNISILMPECKEVGNVLLLKTVLRNVVIAYR